jgi:hypothetical protein
MCFAYQLSLLQFLAVAQGRAYFFLERQDFMNVPGFVVETSEELSINQSARRMGWTKGSAWLATDALRTSAHPRDYDW